MMYTTPSKRYAESLAAELGTSWGYYHEGPYWIVADSISLKLMGCIEGPKLALDYIANMRGE